MISYDITAKFIDFSLRLFIHFAFSASVSRSDEVRLRYYVGYEAIVTLTNVCFEQFV